MNDISHEIYSNKIRKAAILTLTLKSGNYGGILQAYALQKVITKRVGIDTYVDYPMRMRRSVRVFFGITKRTTVRILFRKKFIIEVNSNLHDIIVINTRRFIDEHIKTIDLFEGKCRPSASMLSNYDVYIVGSDQVWRNAYADIKNNLLGYISSRSVRRISYAASFGRDDISEYSTKLIHESGDLANKFDALSVREDSGVRIVKEHWGLRADQHVDPTLLLDRQDYVNLVSEDITNIFDSKGELFLYMLDNNNLKKDIIRKIAQTLELKLFEIMPPKPLSNKFFKANINKYQLQPVTQWIKSFIDAKFVVTDSFHGCVFSMIFNKPFIAIGNEGRGLTRFTSLLKLFGLEDRLVLSLEEVTEGLINHKIDWPKVNQTIMYEQKRSFKYLEKYLNVNVEGK